MNISQIINQLAAVLPQFTGRFSDQVGILSVVVSGGTATVTTTAAHGLATGQSVTMNGVETLTTISGASLVGTVLTLITSTDHDLTFNWPEHENVTMSGFTNASLNGAVTLQASDNRRTFEILTAESAPTLNGGERLHEIISGGLNARHDITVTSATTFTFSVAVSDQSASGGTLSTGVRVSGFATLDRANEEYTKQDSGELWGFVIPGDAIISKSRNAASDAASTVTGAEDPRVRLTEPFNFFVFIPVKDDIGGVAAMDIARGEILKPILQSLFNSDFDTDLSETGKIKTAFLGHGVVGFSGKGYVHRYSFEVPQDLTLADGVSPGNNRAFRDIPLTVQVGDGASVDIDLDKVPL